MGYILPVTNYQYQQYQDRVTQPERDPYPIERLYPTQLDVNYEKQFNNEENHNLADSTKSMEKKQRLAVNPQTIASNDKLYAELTGIGRIINETI